MDEHKSFICVVDDDALLNRVTCEILAAHGYQALSFASADEFLAKKDSLEACDLVISDINMPGSSGLDLCRVLRSKPEAVRLPIILVTGSDPFSDRAKGLEFGADEFISKPVTTRHLIAKIRSLLEIRAQEVGRLRELKSSQGLNQELQRFVSPNIAQRLTLDGHQSVLRPHRAQVTVLFTDLRGFTAFSEKAEPEEVLEVLQMYYTAVGAAAIKYKGTLGHLAGDGIMVFFNDPEPIENHMEIALRMALEARDALNIQKKFWKERNYGIDFGMGLSEGFATIGSIGFDRFSQYSVIGTVSNFASRLCHNAIDGQILVSRRFLSRLENNCFEVESVGEAKLKGIERPVSICNVVSQAKALKIAV